MKTFSPLTATSFKSHVNGILKPYTRHFINFSPLSFSLVDERQGRKTSTSVNDVTVSESCENKTKDYDNL